MKTSSFAKTFRFNLINAVTFHLDGFAQSSFSGVKNRFKLGSPDKFTDLPDCPEELSQKSNSCPIKPFFSFPNR
jgi:hypothetical protein